jgi:pyruvate dehydrogenase E2 component (dihydrolipoamide acetyltransferase)
MAISVVMPALEMAQENGKLLAWRKKEGERVQKGEPLLEIETDKAVVEVESPGDGLLAGVTAQIGAVIPVGETIAWLVAPGEKPPAKVTSAAPTARSSSSSERTSGADSHVAKSAAASSAPQISPKARRLAKELGVDIGSIRGTGPDGVISTDDVQSFADSKQNVVGSAPAMRETLSQVARLMAERTTQSWTSVPHFFLVRDVDAGALLDVQKKLDAEAGKTGARVTLTDLLIALVARTLAKHPQMNSSWTGEGIRGNPDINISVAIAVKDGVVGAVIHKANTLKISEISAQRLDLGERARGGRLRPTDISAGTFTLSNLGMFKVDAFSAIITPPQVAVLAIGAIGDRVVAVKGEPKVRPMMTMTLSSDHRVVDGARAAAFLGELADAIGQPEKWLN